MITLHTFNSGLRLVVNKTDFLRSVSIGIYTAAGSSFENTGNCGISHFVEHMMFKGTKKRSAMDIVEALDSVGAQVNAFTAKEMTCYYTKSTSEHFEHCLEVLSDMFFNSVYADAEMEKEKKVVLEEMSMTEDSPEDVCHELLAKAYFGDNPLGRPILGTQETVKNFTRADILDYIGKHYTACNTVISIIGNIEPETAIAAVGTYLDEHIQEGGKCASYAGFHKPVAVYKSVKKKIEQANIALAFPGFEFSSKLGQSVSLMSTVLGGGMSSRLFQRIREEQGLAYSIYSYVSSYKNNGQFTIFVGTNPSSACQACESIRDELKKIKKDGVSEAEFKKGKAQLKGAFIMAQESASSMMNAQGKTMLLTDTTYDIDERLRDIDAVSQESLKEVIDSVIDFDKVAVANVCGDPDDNLLEIIRN